MVAVTLVLGSPGPSALVSLVTAVAVLLAQLLLVRPRLAARPAAVLAGAGAPGSRAHLAYVGLEVVKVLALSLGGVSLLA